MMNPPVKPGDTIKLYHMEDDISIPPGTLGVVKSVERDPFSKEEGDVIIMVNWETGSSLNLFSNMDFWKKVEPKLEEQDGKKKNLVDRSVDPYTHFMVENHDITRSFDMKYFNNYFRKLRDSGIVNMFGAAPFSYMTSSHLDRYYGENREDNEDFQELLEMQDETRDKFISGLLKFATLKDIDIEEDYKVDSLAKRLSRKLVEFYILFY